jgi:hypothetical protein
MKNNQFILLMIISALVTLAACSTVTTVSPEASAVPASEEPTQVATADSYSDPFAYCAAVGQIDSPDARYTGPIMSDDLFKDYLTAAGLDLNTEYPDSFKQATLWRCMEGKVYACNFGANIPCDSKADTNQTPTQGMNDYCTQNPDSEVIPMSVTGHATLYNWHCKGTTAETVGQAASVDAAGYASSFWTPLTENAAK